MTRMYSHMEDIYFETAEIIDNDLISAAMFILLFILFISYAKITLFELGIFYILFRIFLFGLEEYKKYNIDLKAYEDELNGFDDIDTDSDNEETDSDNEETNSDNEEETEDAEIKTYDLLNFELKELKMKKKE